MKLERDFAFLSRLQNLSGGGSEDALMRGRLSASRHAAERYESWHRPLSVSWELSCRGRSHIAIKILRVETYLLIDTSVELLHSYGPSFALLTPRRALHAPSARCAGGWEFIVPNHQLFDPSAHRFRTAVSHCPRSRESRRVTSSSSARCGDDHSFEEV